MFAQNSETDMARPDKAAVLRLRPIPATGIF